MRIVYGGIDMSVLELHEAVCEPVYDSTKTDHLYCRYAINASVVVNGQAEVRDVAGPPLSYAPTGRAVDHYAMQAATRPPGAADPGLRPADVNVATTGYTYYDIDSGLDPLTGNAVSPVHARAARPEVEIVPAPGPTALTYQLLYSRLNEPRSTLWVFNGDGGPGNLILQSHSLGDYCDCRNGPKPVATNITRAFGDGATYFLNFQVETFVDLHAYTGQDSLAILRSNRFAATHVVDEDGLLTIVVKGEAHFRTDLLYRVGVTPDFFRPVLFVAPPFGFVRGNITVEELADASGVAYSYTDRQMPVHFVAGPYADATQVEIVHRQSIGDSSDIFTTALDAYERGLAIAVNRRFAKESPPDSGRPAKPAKLPPRTP